MKHRTASASLCASLAMILALAAGIGFVAIQPRYDEGTYRVLPEKDEAPAPEKAFRYPLRHWEEHHAVTGEIVMRLGFLHPTIFRVYPDDCLESFSVNDGYDTGGERYCDYHYGHDLDWTSAVKRGENVVRFRVWNHGGAGGFRLSVSPWDPIAFPLIVMALAALGLLAVASFLRWGHNQHERTLLSLFWVGVLLRLVYVIRSPFGVRSYDFDGHVDYVLHVLNHFTIPHANGGWQFYQPPLYYFLNTPFLLPFRWLGASDDVLIRIGQFVSLGFSCIALLAAIWLARMLFPAARRLYAYLFVAFVAVFPGIVFLSSRISNDALIVPLSFAFLGFLLRWWRTGVARDLYAAAFLLGLGLLTKSNFLAFAPVLAVVILFRRGIDLRRKGVLAATILGILVVVTGWYAALRIGMEDQRHLVGNINSNAPGLRVEVRAENFFIFRPHEVLLVPYAHSWSDHAGRNRFWEHLLKSAHTGEWDFGYRVHAVMRLMLALSMLILVVAIGRMFALLWLEPEATAIHWSTVLFLIGSMMALLLVENVGGFQDFRYVPGLVVPVTWYALDGIRVLPRAMRILWTAFFCAFIALSVPFYAALLFPAS